MLKEERQQQILALLGRSGKVVASDLCAELGISEDTVRRDLRDLARAGLLQRVHGGALPRTTTPLAYTVRQGQAHEEKAVIGAAAAALLEPGQLIVLDGGTTALSVARHLPRDFRATVVTNSPPTMVELARFPHVEVVMLGGELFKEAQVAVGAETVAALRSLRADVCVLGAASVHPEAGVSVLDYEESHVKRAMIAAAERLILVAAADKLGKVGPYIVAPASRAAYLVTDRPLPAPDADAYAALGVTVVAGRKE